MESRTIEFSRDEIIHLKTICYAENKRLNDLCDHAVAHGGEFVSGQYHTLCRILAKIDPE